MLTGQNNKVVEQLITSGVLNLNVFSEQSLTYWVVLSLTLRVTRLKLSENLYLKLVSVLND